MISFEQFLEQTDEEIKKKLSIFKEILSKNKAFTVKEIDDGTNIYLYINVKPINDLIKKFESLKLGIRINALGNKLIYRLYHNEKTPVGPGKIAEDSESLKKEIESGKSQEDALKNLYTKSAQEIAEFADTVFKNLESRTHGQNSEFEMDSEYQRNVLNSIVSTILGK